MLVSRLVALALTLGILPSSSIANCVVRDFLSMDLPSVGGRPSFAVALELAFPEMQVDEKQGTLTIAGETLPVGDDRNRSPRDQIANPSILETFSQLYPLSFDLRSREAPWFDPGRARHDGLLRTLYGQTEKAIAANLLRTEYKGTNRSANFSANSRQCVAQQLQAALDAIASEGPDMDKFFTRVGGSFNWRIIAGTERLSSHSFGIAVDFNTDLGGYWRWSGAKEGNVGQYANQYPEALVRHMERYGFIWGGKWHHFDGMHFEYRPELILHARLIGQSAKK